MHIAKCATNGKATEMKDSSTTGRKTKPILAAARTCHDLGLSLIPLPYGFKKSQEAWKKFQRGKAGKRQIEIWFANGPTNGAIVTGKISDIVVVDADNAKSVAWVKKRLPRTPMETKTKNGMHFMYRHPGTPVP